MGPRIVDKKEKAEAIARAALPVFCELGYDRTRMADIAERAGVGKGTVYEYFKDKEEILRYELDRYFEDFDRGALEAVASANGGWDRLEALVAFAVGHVDRWQEHCAVFFDAIGSARVEERGREWFAGMFEKIRGFLAAIIQEGQELGEMRAGVDPTVTAELIVSLYEGYVLLGILGVRCCSTGEIHRGMLQLLEKGIRT